MLKPLIAAAILISFTQSAHAETYHRFWRGTKLATLSTDEFVAGLNQVFIRATVETGSGKGMIAYEPIVTAGMAGLPDEVALVSYADKPTYDALYSTDAGKAYQNLHWRYFDHATSHSLTPLRFNGSVAIEQAYDFYPDYADWQKYQTTVLVYLRNPSETDASYLARATEHLTSVMSTDFKYGTLNRAVLVAQGYWLEYVSGTSLPSDSKAASYVLAVKSEAPATARILPGSGINLQF